MTFWTSIASNILYPSTASDSGIILSNMNLVRNVSQENRGWAGSSPNLLEFILLLDEEIQRLVEDGADGTPPHLDPDVLTAEVLADVSVDISARGTHPYPSCPFQGIYTAISLVLRTAGTGKPHLSVVDADAADHAKRTNEVKRRPQRGAKPNNLDDNIRPAPPGDLHDAPPHPLWVRLEIQRLSPQPPRLLKPLLNRINSEQVLGLKLHCRQHSAQPHGPAPDYNGRDVVRVLHGKHLPRGLGAVVPRRPDVGHED